MEISVRQYDSPPHRVAVLHGGPGAPGYMAPIARELAKVVGVLEPLQSANSFEGQIEELRGQSVEYGSPPLTVIGSSWGAILALFLTARHPELVRKAILIGSAVFDAENSERVKTRRLERLTQENRTRHDTILREMPQASGDERERLFAEWANIFFDADTYDPLTRDLEVLDVQPDVNEKVWSDFKVLRDRPNFLAGEFSKINIPVVVIHGEYDPHPIEGIRPFLESCLREVRFEMLPQCGHYPWIERRARAQFFDILMDEVQ
ncbi:MAG: alpha/beta hydrolase [Candidatus Zixiibacteriota bacterium]|nr:MAG: alpha/beta hydrolase [candidate division Zixibacteria bacterium]